MVLGFWVVCFEKMVCKAFGGLDTDSVCACTFAIGGTRKGDDSFV